MSDDMPCLSLFPSLGPVGPDGAPGDKSPRHPRPGRAHPAEEWGESRNARAMEIPSMARKSNPPTLLERAVAEAASVTPAYPPITAEIRSIVRRLNRGGYAAEQIIEVLAKVGVAVTSEHIATILAPRSPSTAATATPADAQAILVRFPDAPPQEERRALKAGGLRYGEGVWRGTLTPAQLDALRPLIERYAGTVEGAA